MGLWINGCMWLKWSGVDSVVEETHVIWLISPYYHVADVAMVEMVMAILVAADTCDMIWGQIGSYHAYPDNLTMSQKSIAFMNK